MSVFVGDSKVVELSAEGVEHVEEHTADSRSGCWRGMS